MPSLIVKKFNVFKIICFLFFLSSCISFSSGRVHKEDSSESYKLIYDSSKVIEGGVFLIDFNFDESNWELQKAIYLGANIHFYRKAPNHYQALVGIEFGADSKQNIFTLELKNKLNSQIKIVSQKIEFIKGSFPSEKLKVPPRTVSPTKKDLVQIKKDQKFLNQVYSQSMNEVLWDPPVIKPVDLIVTSVYGSNRIYNNKLASVHLGVDFRAPTGTPIKAPIQGKVVCARNLFYTGYTVILDHGYNFFTIYAHLSKLNVKEGEMIKKGTVLGFSGATGRASGPHLHWGARLHGKKVDPLYLEKIL